MSARTGLPQSACGRKEDAMTHMSNGNSIFTRAERVRT